MAIRAALYTAATLLGGLFVGLMIGSAVFEALPGHSIINPSGMHIAAASLPALLGLAGGSALWGVLMGRLGHSEKPRRMALAGMLGFAPIAIAIGITLSILEPPAVERWADTIPVYRLFTLLFVPSVFLVASVGAWAIGRGLHHQRTGALAMQAGLWAAAAFLVVNVVMDSLGWRIGAPDAAERFTMLTVMLVGNFGAALAGGAAIGRALMRDDVRHVIQPRHG
jgi:hypothetical protein